MAIFIKYALKLIFFKVKRISIKNKKPLLIGVVSGIVSVIFISELFQALYAYLVLGSEVIFNFYGVSFNAEYSFNTENTLLNRITCSVSSTLYLIATLETGSYFMKKSNVGNIRFMLILFNLITVVGLIVSVFYNTLLILVKTDAFNDFYMLSEALSLSWQESMVFMVFMILLITVYLNITAKRTVEYINY